MLRDSFSANQPQRLPLAAYVEVDGQRIDLEVATTPEQQMKGLQFRESLPSDRGMLFPVEPPQPISLWMRNVSFPLDMIFLHEGIVIEIAQQVPPCDRSPCPLYGPDEAVDAVVEVAGGTADQLGLEEGDRLGLKSP